MAAKRKKTKARKVATGPTPNPHPDAGLTKPQLRKLHGHLIEEQETLFAGIRRHVGEATADSAPLAEEGDLAQRATEQNYLLRLADKQRKLLGQIQSALEKMENGEYGVCEGTGEPIGFRRLEIRPWARYSVEYKERLDRQNR